MYTLKIKWMRYEKQDPPDDPDASTQYNLADEATLFIAADQVVTHHLIQSMDELSAWEEGSFFNYKIDPTEATSWGARLIQVTRNGKETWYLASMAWVLGPDGNTIERLI